MGVCSFFDPCVLQTVNGLEKAGSVYILDQALDPTQSLAQIVAPTPEDDARFGDTLAVFGTNLAIGTPQEPVDDLSTSGAVYWTTLGDTTAIVLERVVSPDPAATRKFGNALKYNGGMVCTSLPRTRHH